MPPVRSRKTTVRQEPPAADGFTQASRVMPLVRSSDDAAGTVTTELVPSNESALPCLPADDQVVFASVPVLFLPEASLTVGPLPSSNPQEATRPGGGPAVG